MSNFRPVIFRSLALVAAFAAPLSAVSIAAQEVVQPLPSAAAQQLNEALRRLAQNPESLPALIAAGRASIELDDADAAEGFFVRARAVDGSDHRVLSGLALVALHQGDPVLSLDFFALADAAGASVPELAAERGLAHDLIGENVQAQQFYDIALSRNPENAETVRRLALSFAISGNQDASEATLLPLLQRRDLAAYRTRAFALAILGREDEAVAIAETMLPARLARRMAPYLRYMTRLTPAQQARAANLGQFPDAADIGRDEPRLVRSERPATPATTADSRLVPTGEPLAPANAEPVEVAVTVPDLQPEPELDDIGELTGPILAGQDQAPSPPAEEERADLVDAFADFDLADAPPTATPGAVDITSIEPVREEPPPPAHPSRHWVQVATGQNTSAFRFDWRRIVRNAGGLLDGMEPYRARWNSTNRLVTGPFDSADEAQELVTALRREGVRTFRWTSREGEQVVAID